MLRTLFTRVVVPYEVAEEIRAGGRDAFGLDVVFAATPKKETRLETAGLIFLHDDDQAPEDVVMF